MPTLSPFLSPVYRGFEHSGLRQCRQEENMIFTLVLMVGVVLILGFASQRRGSVAGAGLWAGSDGGGASWISGDGAAGDCGSGAGDCGGGGDGGGGGD
jgi:hypothetical protein